MNAGEESDSGGSSTSSSGSSSSEDLGCNCPPVRYVVVRTREHVHHGCRRCPLTRVLLSCLCGFRSARRAQSLPRRPTSRTRCAR